jgi:hypothetical protein
LTCLMFLTFKIVHALQLCNYIAIFKSIYALFIDIEGLGTRNHVLPSLLMLKD